MSAMVLRAICARSAQYSEKIMKLLNSLVPLFLLSTALTVAAGAVYVSVQAAQQSDDAAAPAVVEDVAAEAAAAQPVAAQDPPDKLPAELLPAEIHQTREHNLMLSEEGVLTGRISSLRTAGGNLFPVEGIKVRIIRNGRPLGSATTGDDGKFTVAGLSEGVASFIATSESAMAIFGVRIVSKDEGTKGNDLDIIHAVAVTGADLDTARKIISSNLPSRSDNRFTGPVKAPAEEFPHGNGRPSTGLSHHQVQLQANGILKGSVNVIDYRTGRYREIKDLRLHFISGGKPAATTKVNADGQFTVHGLHAGVYSVVSTGSDGVFAIGIDVIDSVANLPANSPYRFVSLPQELDFNISPTNPADLNESNAEENTDGDLNPPPAVFSPPSGGGGGGLSGGTGGGGGSGFGGAAGLIGAGIAGGIGYALGQDDNDASPSN